MHYYSLTFKRHANLAGLKLLIQAQYVCTMPTFVSELLCFVLQHKFKAFYCDMNDK